MPTGKRIKITGLRIFQAQKKPNTHSNIAGIAPSQLNKIPNISEIIIVFVKRIFFSFDTFLNTTFASGTLIT